VTKQELSQIRDLGNEIKAKLEMCDQLRDLASRTSVDFSFDKVSGGNKQGSRLENNAVNIMMIERDMRYDVYALSKIRNEAMAIINKMQTSKYRSVLINYYINCKSWEETAESMAYSLRNIYYIHGQALNELKSLH